MKPFIVVEDQEADKHLTPQGTPLKVAPINTDLPGEPPVKTHYDESKEALKRLDEFVKRNKSKFTHNFKLKMALKKYAQLDELEFTLTRKAQNYDEVA